MDLETKKEIKKFKEEIKHTFELLKIETGCDTDKLLQFLLVSRPFEIIFPSLQETEGEEKNQRIDNIIDLIKRYCHLIHEFTRRETIFYRQEDKQVVYYLDNTTRTTSENLARWFMFNIGRYISGEQYNLDCRVDNVHNPKGLVSAFIKTFNLA